MKQTSLYTLALAAALMLIPAGCSDEQYDNSQQPGDGATGPLITVTATQGDRPQTRLDYDDPNDPDKPIEVTWATGDQIYVGKDWSAYSSGSDLSQLTEYFSPFTLKEGGAGSKNAEFEGNAPTGMQNGDQLYAIYGHGESIYPDMQEPGILLFSYNFQRQTANDDKSHLSTTDFMVATTTYETGQQPVFAFTHLGAMMKFTLTLPTAGLTVKELTLTTIDGTKPFSKGVLWKNDGALALPNSSNSNTDQLSLFLETEDGSGITLTGTKVLTAYMMVAPTTITKETPPIAGTPLELKVTDADGVAYTAPLKGSDIEQGKYYTIEAELKKAADQMSFTIAVSDDTGMEYAIPFFEGALLPADITVDWGDGSQVTNTTAGTELTFDTFKHTYKAAGTYTITITSSQMDATQQQIPYLFFKLDTCLVSMDTPMLNTGDEDFSETFYGCTSLKELPTGLFDKNTQVTSFKNCFEDCANLTKLLTGLFDKNTQVKSFDSCFNGCTSLTELPKGLFDKNKLATSFDSCFNGCTSLKELPTGLFDKNTEVDGFGGCFSYCTSLKELPTGLFDKNTQARNFTSCFQECSNLVLNDKIFSSTASNDRFKDLTIGFTYCFYNTGSALTAEQQQGSVAPRLWEYSNAASWSTYDCYTGCKADNLAEDFPATGWGTPAN